MAVKPASAWGPKWSTGVLNGGNAWAANYIAVGDAVFKAGAAAVGTWQAAVADPGAATRFTKALNETTMAMVSPTVNGAGKQKYTAAATTKNANYNTFATEFQPVLSQIVASLPARGPRGSAANVQRMIDLVNALIAKRGQFVQ